MTADYVPPVITGYGTRDDLVAAVRAEFDRAVADPVASAGIRLFVFHGHRIPLVGDAGRALVFGDGTRTEVLAPPPAAADDGRLLPPGWRPPA